MISTSIIRIFPIIAALLVAMPEAAAFWRIWREQAPPERARQVSVPLAAVRNSGCGRPDAVQVFGDHFVREAFMDDPALFQQHRPMAESLDFLTIHFPLRKPDNR